MTRKLRLEPTNRLRLTLLFIVSAHLLLVVAAELLAARQLNRFTGYAASDLSVFTACVLAALALGYASGQRESVSYRLRARLAWNLAFITPFCALALSQEFTMSVLGHTRSLGTGDAARAALYSSFLALPMYLLGQNLHLLQRTFRKLPNRPLRRSQRAATLGGIVLSSLGALAGLELSGYYAPVVYTSFVFAVVAVLGRRVGPFLLVLGSLVPAFLLSSM